MADWRLSFLLSWTASHSMLNGFSGFEDTKRIGMGSRSERDRPFCFFVLFFFVFFVLFLFLFDQGPTPTTDSPGLFFSFFQPKNSTYVRARHTQDTVMRHLAHDTLLKYLGRDGWNPFFLYRKETATLKRRHPSSISLHLLGIEYWSFCFPLLIPIPI